MLDFSRTVTKLLTTFYFLFLRICYSALFEIFFEKVSYCYHYPSVSGAHKIVQISVVLSEILYQMWRIFKDKRENFEIHQMWRIFSPFYIF